MLGPYRQDKEHYQPLQSEGVNELLNYQMIYQIALRQAHLSGDKDQVELRREQLRKVSLEIRDVKRRLLMKKLNTQAQEAFKKEKKKKPVEKKPTEQELEAWVEKLKKELRERKEEKDAD